MTARIFVNYRRRQESGWAADAIATRLATEFGSERIFLDVKGIPPGADFAAQIRSEMAQAAALVVVLGKDWYKIQDEETGDKRIGMEDDWVREEIRTAISRKIPIIPLLIDDAELPPDKALPSDIKSLRENQAWQVRQAHVDDDLRRIIDELAKRTGIPFARAGSATSDEYHYSAAIKDLLYVRDTFHAHLYQKPNVIGTAIGKYLIRKSEPWPARAGARSNVIRGRAEPRTLENSEVRSYSNPCVLVFVSRWATVMDFNDPAQAIDPDLALPDGRRVPVCVVLARFVRSDPARHISFSAGPVGGGYPVTSMFQNVQRVATLGCLVKDATAVYALTSLRAVGDEGREVAIVIEGGARRIGRSDARHVGALPFSAVYPGLSGTQTDLELDAGLVRLDDLRGVTSQIFGVGEPGSMSELSPATAGLDLMGLAVKSSSCIAGVTSGKIAGLFYRFRSGEGHDTICELLIGPNEDSPGSGHAERLASVATSGALWLAEDSDGTRPPQPIACWLAGQRLDSTVATFALAASLSTVAKLLDVSIVRDWNAGLPTQWASPKPLDGPDETGKHVSRAPSKANSKRDVRTTGTSKKRRR